MRWLAVVSVLVVTGCASVPQPTSPGMATVAMHPPATLERLWLVQTRSDEITVFDTRMLQALRKTDEVPALNANGSAKRPGVWLGVGLGVIAGSLLVEETYECVMGWLLFDDCD